MKTAIAPEVASTLQPWSEANQRCLDLQLRRLRLLLQRRVLWLRQQWKHDPLQSYQGLVISEVQADALLAGEDRHAEAHFNVENPESAALTQMLGQIEQEVTAQEQSRTATQSLLPLDALVRLFGLTCFERDTLLLCLAPELDPSFERLYAYVQDDATRKCPTPHLALTLLTGDFPCAEKGRPRENLWTARDSFLPQAPLLRFRLIHIEPPAPQAATAVTRSLRLDDRVMGYLRGVNRLDERAADLLRPLDPALLAPSNQSLVDSLFQSQQWRTSQRPWTPLNLVGPRGVGKRAVARALCDRMGLRIYSLETARLPAAVSERQELLHLVEREMVLMQSALYVDSGDPAGADSTQPVAIKEVVERLNTFIVLGSRERWPTDRPMVTAAVPKPDAASQRVLWENALATIPHSLNGRIDALVEQFDVGPAIIFQAVAAAGNRSSLRTSEARSEITADDLWQACRDVARKHMDDLAQRIVTCNTWDDIVLPEDVFRQLQDIATQVAHRFHVYETWGFGARLSRGRGLTALFSGASGTGKTMAAEILANHLKLDLYRIDLAGVVNKYIGETEKNLRKVFDAAEQGGAILFFDEADALFGKRTEVKDSHDRYANIEVNYLLQRMEEYRGLAILATNRKTVLDRAFLRRLRFLVDFPSPDSGSRRAIWTKVFPSAAAVDHLDFDELARLEIPGGNIKNTAINAAFLAAGDGTSIAMTHVMRAARREYTKIDKLITPAEFGRYHQMVRS